MPPENEKRDRLPSAFATYGGTKAIRKSGFFWIAMAVMIPTFSQWTKDGWWDVVLPVIPNLLGFTLGGFALITAIGDEKFRAAVAKAKDEGDAASVHQELSATFLFFITIQTSSLLGALICKGLWSGTIPELYSVFKPVISVLGGILWFFSYLLFLYGIVLVLAAAKWIYMLSVAYEASLRMESASSDPDESAVVQQPDSEE